MDDIIDGISNMITDDPDIFNEDRSVEGVWFHIHNRTADFALKVASRVFNRKPFVKPTIKGDKCVLVCSDIPDPVSYIADELTENKFFQGKFDADHPEFDEESFDRYARFETGVSRFGLWEVFAYPSGVSEGQYRILRLQHIKRGVPLYQADATAAEAANYQLPFVTESSNQLRNIWREKYVDDLVENHGQDQAAAEEMVRSSFPSLFDVSDEAPKPVERANIKEKIDDLLGQLNFMSPNERKRYLDDSLNRAKQMLLLLFLASGGEKAIRYVRERVSGGIPGLVSAEDDYGAGEGR